MDFNPEEAQKYLEGVDYPANKEDLASTAESNGAPDELVEMIRTMDKPEYSDQEAVITELRSFPHGG